MPQYRTPGSPYAGVHKKSRQKMTMHEAGVPRRRVCFYLRDDIAAWLALFSGSVHASQSYVVEAMLERMKKEEDPDGIGGFERYD